MHPPTRRAARRLALMSTCASVAVIGLVSASCQNRAAEPRAGIRIEVGADAPAIVAAAPPGSIFVFAVGVHREVEILARDGDTYRGEPGAILSGARVLEAAAWTAGTSGWYVDGQDQEGLEHGTVEEGDNARARRPEELFLDGVRATHVGSVAELGPGRWFLDYDADRLWLGEDPAASTLIEVSVTTGAFGGSGISGVTIEDLTIEHYASPTQHGAIGTAGEHETHDWVVRRVTVQGNHGVGIRLGPGMRVAASVVRDNGQEGIAGDGRHRGDGPGSGYEAPIVITDTEVAGNGVLELSPFFERGGIKIKNATAGSEVSGNWIHDNRGIGAWWDIDVVGSEVYENLSERNDVGIEYEISFGPATIARNLLIDNGVEPPWGLPYGSAIFISSSAGVEVRDNVILGASYGVVLYAQERGGSDHLGRTRALAEVTVTGNTIETGEIAMWEYDRLGTATDLRVDGNTFLAPADDVVMRVGRDDLGLIAWRSRGFDLTSTFGAPRGGVVHPVDAEALRGRVRGAPR